MTTGGTQEPSCASGYVAICRARSPGPWGELGGAAVAYLATGSLAAAAITATIGASAGYYAAAYVTALRWSYRGQDHRRWPSRALAANLLALRSVAVEFGPAEFIDSLAIRPVAFYTGPLIFHNTIAGWIFASSSPTSRSTSWRS